jgi:hypothetical protein
MPWHDLVPGARFWRWWILHNPTYLLSAAFMAVGARLLLVSPDTRAGDLGMVLLTLGALQLYEWLAAGILLMLHRSGHCPEDERMLLLVACLFWTGPLAATTEMTARNPGLGLGCAVAAALIAWLELRAIVRRVAVRVSLWSRLQGGACLALLAVAPALLRIPEAVDGQNELYLYASWWILGIIPLVMIGTVRVQTLDRRYPPAPLRAWRWLWVDLSFCGVVLSTTTAQMVAMNYGLFGHARPFYASPLMIALAIVGMELLARIGYAGGWVLWSLVISPIAAILLSAEGFHPAVPADRLPAILRDPQTPVLLAASAAWWFGYWRHRRPVLIHFAVAAFVLAIAQMMFSSHLVAHRMITRAPSVDAARNVLAGVFYGVAVYFLVFAWARRSRTEAFAAVLCHQIAVTVLVWDRWPADLLAVLVVTGWNLLAGVYVLSDRPAARTILMPIVLLVLVSWGFEFGDSRWWARGHAVVMTCALMIAAITAPHTPLRKIAWATCIAHVLFYLTHSLGRSSRPIDSLCILAAFLLLALGAFLSWNKQRWSSAAPAADR